MITIHVINYSQVTYHVIVIEFLLKVLLARLCGVIAILSFLSQDLNSHCSLFIPIIPKSRNCNQILFAHTLHGLVLSITMNPLIIFYTMQLTPSPLLILFSFVTSISILLN